MLPETDNHGCHAAAAAAAAAVDDAVAAAADAVGVGEDVWPECQNLRHRSSVCETSAKIKQKVSC